MSVLFAAVSLPFLKPPPPIDLGVKIQVFGMIVAAGVLIGAALLRRYAEWHGVSDEHIRGITGWITVAGFIGAHELDVIMYQWDRISEPVSLWPSHWPLVLRFWDGISSYGGFVGGAIGFALYVWWKRLPVRLFADIALVGLMPAFSIGRIGCTVVSDYIGSAVDKAHWYAALAMDYPRNLNMAHLAEHYPGTSEYIRAWNLRPDRVPLPRAGQRRVALARVPHEEAPELRPDCGAAHRPALLAGPVLPRLPAPRRDRPTPLRTHVRAVGSDRRLRSRGLRRRARHQERQGRRGRGTHLGRGPAPPQDHPQGGGRRRGRQEGGSRSTAKPAASSAAPKSTAAKSAATKSAAGTSAAASSAVAKNAKTVDEDDDDADSAAAETAAKDAARDTAKDDKVSEAEDKAAAADETAGDEGVDDPPVKSAASAPDPNAPKPAVKAGAAIAPKPPGAGNKGGKNKRKR